MVESFIFDMKILENSLFDRRIHNALKSLDEIVKSHETIVKNPSVAESPYRTETTPISLVSRFHVFTTLRLLYRKEVPLSRRFLFFVPLTKFFV